jgi:hypothetical protein
MLMGLDPVDATGEMERIPSAEFVPIPRPGEPQRTSVHDDHSLSDTAPLARVAPSSAPRVPSDPAHPARSTTGKQKRVVTKQTEDGSYEIVYEDVDDDEDLLDFDAARPQPLWKKKPLLAVGIAFASVLVLFIAIGGAALILGGNGETVPTDDSSLKDEDELRGRGKKDYRYVAPTGNTERVNLDDDDEGGDDKVEDDRAEAPDNGRRPLTRPNLGLGNVPVPTMPIERDLPTALPQPHPTLGGPLYERNRDALKERAGANRDDEGEQAADQNEEAPEGEPEEGGTEEEGATEDEAPVEEATEEEGTENAEGTEGTEPIELNAEEGE